MTTLTATPRPGEYLMFEADHERSHDQITVALSQTLVAGQVIGKLAVGVATAVYAANGGNTGNFTNAMAGTPYVSGCQAGIYSILFTAATKFNVTDPNGRYVGSGTTGVAFSNQIAFTITAGGTPAVVGDGATITMTAGATAGQVVAFDPAGTNGSQVAAGILFSPITTGAGATARGVITARADTVNGNKLTWPAGISAGNKAAAIVALGALGIIVRM